MGEIIGFPDRSGSADVAHTVGGYDQDTAHVVEAIKGVLPQAALDLISPEEMRLAAARGIARLYEVRAIREVAQERTRAAAREACEAATAGERAPPSRGRGEYDALFDLFGGRPPSDDPPGPAVA